MNNLPILQDLRVFLLVAKRVCFAAAAEEIGASPAFISKRIAILESVLNVTLLHRTTRRVSITEDGERIYEWAQRILNDVNQMLVNFLNFDKNLKEPLESSVASV